MLGMFKTMPMANITDILGIKVVHALPGVIVAQFTVTVSFCIRLVMASFDAVNPKFEQVARSLGASLPRVLFQREFTHGKKRAFSGLDHSLGARGCGVGISYAFCRRHSGQDGCNAFCCLSRFRRRKTRLGAYDKFILHGYCRSKYVGRAFYRREKICIAADGSHVCCTQ